MSASPCLPSGWANVALADVAEKVTKVDPRELYHSDFVYVDISSVDNSRRTIADPKRIAVSDAPSRARQLVRTGDVVFSTVRTYLKNIALVGEMLDGQIASTGFCVIRPSSCLDSRFVFHLVQTDEFVSALSELQRGTSYPAVRDSDVFAQQIPLPPLPEQRRIVARLEELFSRLDAGTAALEQARAQLALYRQAVLRDAFQGKLTAAWREAHRDELEPASLLLERICREREAAAPARGRRQAREPEPLDTADLPELPEGWVWARLGEVVAMTQNGFSRRKSKGSHQAVVLRLSDIENGAISFEGLRRIGVSQDELSRYRLASGDMLCVRVNGSPNLVGRIVTFSGYTEPAMFCDHFIRLVPAVEPLTAFIRAFADTQSARRFVELNMVSSAGQNTVSQTTMLDMPIPIAPLLEQTEILHAVERTTTASQLLTQALDEQVVRSERLRSSLLRDAFSGKLVPQDPSDEPAEALLARIQQARQADQPTRHVRRSKPRQERLL